MNFLEYFEDESHFITCISEILENINEGIIVTNKEGKILIYNKQLSEFEGLSQESVVGKYLDEVYKWRVENSEHMQVLKTGIPINEQTYETITNSGFVNHLIAKTLPITLNESTYLAYSISQNINKIQDIYSKALDHQHNSKIQNPDLKNGTRFTFSEIISNSLSMGKLIFEAKKTVFAHSPTLVYGETGVGKELIVQSIHNAGIHRNAPFVALNCAALPESLLESLLFGTVKGAFTGAENTIGYIEQAKNGTLYLDEINSMPLNLQAKLLRVLQEKKFRSIGGTVDIPMNCKIISSINLDPFICIKEGTLRQDLYYRLSVITLYIPALRDRKEDIPLLIDYFTEKYNSIYGNRNITLNLSLRESLAKYSWPGNVRELEHLIENAILMAEKNQILSINNMPINLQHKLYTEEYSTTINTSQNLNEILREVEKNIILDALEKNNGNISKAAKSIGIGRQNMQYRLKKFSHEIKIT